ncbi:hypothetical protein K0M31_001111 [Melipona bicolor]|uniref:Uncharacterized protein n=1 Tax=Melipona bicolor TaxID=60889 RepID=A0AA40KXG7_9HYME|nr:hypothetical protein K0M31_001111 [Melipona bicolor]
MLKERAENLMFEDAQTTFEIIVIIRKKFSESASTPVDNNRITGNIKMTENNLFGLKFEYKSARVSDTEAHRITPLENKLWIILH